MGGIILLKYHAKVALRNFCGIFKGEINEIKSDPEYHKDR